MIGKKDFIRIKNNSSKLFVMSREIKILRSLNWDNSVRSAFFNSKSETIPKVDYPKFDFGDLRANLKDLKSLYGDTPYDKWLEEKTNDILSSIDLLQSHETKQFLKKSEQIYGSPNFVLRDGKTSTLNLAKKFEGLIDSHLEQFSQSLQVDPIPISDIKKNIENLAKAKNKNVKDICICMLERDRHKHYIDGAKSLGSKLKLISDGDVAGSIFSALKNSEVDMYVGIGGAPEGVLAASAIKCLGGQFQARLKIEDDDEVTRAKNW